MKTPTLEEVKEYFKDAEKINSIDPCHNELVGKISRADKRGIHFWGKEYWFFDKEKMNIMLWSPKQGYAKILSYKEPKEKMYKITREQIIELCMPSLKTNRERFKLIFPEVFETKLTVGKWYWSHNGALWYVEAFESSQRITAYGFNAIGDWSNSTNRQPESLTEATEQEVMMALNKECERIGIKTGAFIKDVVTDETVKIEDNYRYYANNCLKHLGHTLFHNGKFAEVIKTLTIPEAEAKLKELGVNAKIV